MMKMNREIEIKYLGHSGFVINFGGKKLVFDPFIRENPKSEILIDNLEADYILLSHGHFDHVADAEYIAKITGAEIISSFEVMSWFEKKGLKGYGMNIGGKHTFDFGTIKYVNAVHSSQMPDDSYGGPAGGFVIWNKDSCFYFSGDTALTMDMKLIPMTCPSLDFAILPVGDYFTMGYEDALLAAQFVECGQIIACHHDTFDIIKLDTNNAAKAFENNNIKLMIPKVGETIKL